MIGIIIQARMGSTRLPGKVIRKIEGKTVLGHVIERLKRIEGVKIILATTVKKEDDVLEKIAKNCKIPVFRGLEDDVLDRYYQAAKSFGIDPIVRITADCPVLDTKVAEKVIDFYLINNFDYVSNIHPVSYPDGLDVEVFSFKVLEKSWKKAKLKSEREHVTSYILKNPRIFKTGNVANNKDYSSFRLTLDEKEDLILIRKIYKELYDKNPFFGMEEILGLFEKKPELVKINQHIGRNDGYFKSL
ncbi:MAG: glycosyltransferase family protein [Candidatus Staskawiczbacteria bacterium]|jgi:spore coat polysaccharide biosynthesis protein SpsF (cytidylyltransferase family)